MANRWLFKTDPEVYSFQQLQKEKRTIWDGVKNPLALKHLARVRTGDRILIYHTGGEKAVVGVAEAVGLPYPDPAKSDPKLIVVDIVAGKSLPRPVTLAEMRDNATLAGFDLLRLPRLSVMPVSQAQWSEIEKMAG